MNKSEFCRSIHEVMMDIRLEYKLSQKLMSENLGVSKKTYIQLEKQRTVLKWSEAVALATIFMNSKILQDKFDEDIISVIHGVVFDQKKYSRNKL